MNTPPPSRQEFAASLAVSLDMNGASLKSAASLSSATPPDPRDESVRQVLARCGELARGSAALGRTNNSISLSILARAILENLILILWVTISESNAVELKSAAIAELTRAAKINLQSGKATITNRKTGEDETASFLADDRMKNLPKRKSVESRADEAGILDLYNVFYRFMSLETHGHDLSSENAPGEWEMAIMYMQGIGALTKAVGHAGTLWLLHRKKVENKILKELLGLE